MPLEIPGYYFDPEKGKYFKIEKAQTAPSNSSWSSDAVKRRKTEEKDAQRLERRRQKLRNHVKRHAGLGRQPVVCGLMEREVGGMGMGMGRVREGDVGVEGWVGGVVSMGRVEFGDGDESAGGGFGGRGEGGEGEEGGRGEDVKCFWVGGDVAYTSIDEEILLGKHISADSNGMIHPHNPAHGHHEGQVQAQGQARGRIYAESVRCPQMSSVKYHEASHKMLVTSREVDHTCGLYLFSPSRGDDGGWLLGETNFYQRLSMRHRHKKTWAVNNCTPAPSSSSSLLCLMATNAGIVRVASNDTMSLLEHKTPPSPPESHLQPHSPHQSGPGSGSRSPYGKSRFNAKSKQTSTEIFDISFQHGSNDVFFAGGRSPAVYMSDLRAPEREWTSFRHGSSVGRLSCVNEYQVVACGPRNCMTLYDVRYSASASSEDVSSTGKVHGINLGREKGGPLVTFPEYKNEAYLHIGFDTSPLIGAVAAAQEDGKVSIFSLESGRKIRCDALDGGRKSEGPVTGVNRYVKGPPVRALMFAEGMRGDASPSLWVGEGMGLVKYGFGVEDEEW